MLKLHLKKFELDEQESILAKTSNFKPNKKSKENSIKKIKGKEQSYARAALSEKFK